MSAACAVQHGARRGPRRQRKRGEDAQTAVRRCLSCLRDFRSSWKGHRICPLCAKGVNDGQRGFDEYLD